MFYRTNFAWYGSNNWPGLHTTVPGSWWAQNKSDSPDLGFVHDYATFSAVGVLVAAKPVVEMISSPMIGFIIERQETFRYLVLTFSETSYFWSDPFACVPKSPDVKVFTPEVLTTCSVDLQNNVLQFLLWRVTLLLLLMTQTEIYKAINNKMLNMRKDNNRSK